MPTKHRPLRKIAAEIYRDWGTAAIRSPAHPFLHAMLELDTIDDKYGDEDGLSIVEYFLSNAATWRGEVARRVKRELNSIVDERVLG